MKAIAITSPAVPQEALLRSALERISYLENELQKMRTAAAESNKKIRIRQANRLITASPNEILYIQSANNYSRIFMKGGAQFYTSRTLKSWERELSSEIFLRCHRTFLVNRDSISEINRFKKELILTDGASVPTSRRFQKSCLSAISTVKKESNIQPDSVQVMVYSLPAGKILSIG